MELTIKPVKAVEITDTDEYHKNLPCIERNNGSLILLIAPTASGKTTLINNLLYNRHMWGKTEKRPQGAFDSVFVWSPSIYLDDSSRFMLNDFICSDTFKDEELEQIKQNQLMLPKEERGKLMLVVDDSVGLQVLKTKSALTYYCTRNRHLNCNILLSVQNYRACNSIMRNNAKCFILMYGIYNTKELMKLEEEIGDVFRGTLIYAYKKYCNKKYMFLTLYPREVPCRMLLNFTTEIDWKREVRNAKNFKIEEYESDDETETVQLDEGDEYEK